jgi:hypothetical protein
MEMKAGQQYTCPGCNEAVIIVQQACSCEQRQDFVCTCGERMQLMSMVER